MVIYASIATGFAFLFCVYMVFFPRRFVICKPPWFIVITLEPELRGEIHGVLQGTSKVTPFAGTLESESLLVRYWVHRFPVRRNREDRRHE